METPPAQVALETPLAAILSARTAGSFARRLGLETVRDALNYFPRRYAHRGELTAISSLPIGEHSTIVAEVVNVTRRSMRARKGSILEVTLTDGTGVLTATFFNVNFERPGLRPGARGVFSGQVGRYQNSVQLTHPEYELFEDDAAEGVAQDWADLPIPIYPATASISSRIIGKSIAAVLDAAPHIDEIVDAPTRAAAHLLDLADAYEQIHRPRSDAEARAAQETLRYTEAYVLQAALLAKRAANASERATPRVPSDGGFLAQFDAALPWQLTRGQQEVSADILADIARDHPMNRLVQGEVGSGKTVVALRAMLAVVESGGQAALLAPTEVLASQHFASIVDLLGPDLAARVHPVLITGGQAAGERKRAALATAVGQAGIVVGTHALISDKTIFFDLGLVVVDEQHRFGVAQREALRAKAPHSPHVLLLTATPIPRTVAMTVFGDLDVSSLRELPAGRQAIESFVVPLAEKPAWSARVWARLAEEVAAGRQGFVVCGLIDSDESGERESVENTIVKLSGHPATANLRIAGLTGRMSSAEKAEVMGEFVAGRVDVLVATTVVEVGVNVPNASVMVVLDAERFGISQLHQLRGRIGRGVHPGVALFVTEAAEGTVARARLDAVAASSDGFELAEADLKLRSEGDVLGAAQSGRRSSLKLLRVVDDAKLIAAARERVAGIVEADPLFEAHPALRAAIHAQVGDDQEDYLVSS